jgi:hypothetical protein
LLRFSFITREIKITNLTHYQWAIIRPFSLALLPNSMANSRSRKASKDTP